MRRRRAAGSEDRTVFLLPSAARSRARPTLVRGKMTDHLQRCRIDTRFINVLDRAPPHLPGMLPPSEAGGEAVPQNPTNDEIASALASVLLAGGSRCNAPGAGPSCAPGREGWLLASRHFQERSAPALLAGRTLDARPGRPIRSALRASRAAPLLGGLVLRATGNTGRSGRDIRRAARILGLVRVDPGRGQDRPLLPVRGDRHVPPASPGERRVPPAPPPHTRLKNPSPSANTNGLGTVDFHARGGPPPRPAFGRPLPGGEEMENPSSPARRCRFALAERSPSPSPRGGDESIDRGRPCRLVRSLGRRHRPPSRPGSSCDIASP